MLTSVDRIASEFDRSPYRVRVLLREGRLTGRKVRGHWMVELESAVAYFHRAVRDADAELDRTYGIEIEFYNASSYAVISALADREIECHDEGYNHNDHRRTWKIVSDSSLNGNNAHELVSPVLSGEDGLTQIEKVCEALSAVGAKVNKSCGLHVHFGVEDLTVAAVQNLVVNYTNNRGIIDGFMAPSRRINSWGTGGYYYCKNYTDYEVEQFSHCQTIEQMAMTAHERYRAVNLKAYTRHGTIEFRQHQGTTDFTKISNWIRFGMALVRFSKTQTSSWNRVTDMVSSLNLSDGVQQFFVRRAQRFDHMGA